MNTKNYESSPATKNQRNRRFLPFVLLLILLLVAVFATLLIPYLFRSEPSATAPIRLPVRHPSIDFVSAGDLCKIPPTWFFAFPLGSPRGALSYNAQPFAKNNHLGDDWNGIGGWNSDFGDPVHTIAPGLVTFAAQLGGGWGGIVIVQHRLANPPTGSPEFIQSLYGHLDEIHVNPGDIVPLGAVLGTVGNAGGRYWAHLHLEVRTFTTRHIGAGYRADTTGWLDPTALIRSRLAPYFLLNEPPAS